jgi:hypothetical protein
MRDPQNAGTRIWGLWLQAVEWARLKWSEEVGEEIAATAEK